jgi:hypothetical protein
MESSPHLFVSLVVHGRTRDDRLPADASVGDSHADEEPGRVVTARSGLGCGKEWLALIAFD